MRAATELKNNYNLLSSLKTKSQNLQNYSQVCLLSHEGEKFGQTR
jgi:hypothetical protein